jgi:antitoxin (DNA-binding transcriptional repressor) of toxin-antitoxin stability system
MKTATVRQVRHDFGTVMGWVADGESVQVSKRGEVIALISPPAPKASKPRKRPDFFARMRRIYGDDWEKRAPSKNSVIEERESRPY